MSVRFAQHPESTVLVVLQVKYMGMWYSVSGTTTHSLDDRRKAELIKEWEDL